MDFLGALEVMKEGKIVNRAHVEGFYYMVAPGQDLIWKVFDDKSNKIPELAQFSVVDYSTPDWALYFINGNSKHI